MVKKNGAPIATLGAIILIFGVIFTISFAVRGGQFTYGLIATGLAVIVGVLLIAWAFND